MVQQPVSEFLSRFLSETGAVEIWVACSGGLDSMALLSLVRDFSQKRGISVGALHLNHGLRSGSRDDELFVAAHALNYNLPLIVGQSRNLREQARTDHLSLETAARQVRYAFFQRFLKERAGAVIVTAHTATDQVETILMNLMRGAGLRGVKGIPRRRGRIGRPLLQVTRNELADYVSCKRIAYREDPTNSSLEFSRNRVRHELLPIIRKLGGSGVEERMAGAGLRLAADLTLIDGRLDDLWSQVKPGKIGLTVERILLQKCESALLPHFLGRMIRRAGAVKQVSSRVLDDLCGLVGSPGERRESRYDLGAGQVFRALPKTIFIGMGENLRGSDESLPEYQLSLPDFGFYSLPHRLGTLRVEPVSTKKNLSELKKQAEKQKILELVDADQLHFPLQIRNRRPGDRFQPLGMQGRSCKLKNFLADRHLSRFARSALPLLLDQKGRIVWVVGERLDHRFRHTSQSRSYVELYFEQSPTTD